MKLSLLVMAVEGFQLGRCSLRGRISGLGTLQGEPHEQVNPQHVERSFGSYVGLVRSQDG